MEFATGAMGTLLPKLGGLLLEEYNLKKSVKKGIGDLKTELENMQAALVKLSSVPLDKLDHQVKIWANEVRELSYAIEDSLDSSMVRIEGLEPTKPNIVGFFKKTRNKITKFKARHEIANDIKDIECKVMKVKERYERYKIYDVIANPGTTTVDPRLPVLYSKASDLVGIDKAVNDLTKMLSMADDPSEKKATTISVVGSGGLGKTTLAKAVYDKHSKKFDCAGFVPVGRNPDIKKVLKDIIFEFDMQMYNAASTMDERQLINLLQKFLLDKRYLVVIDDIWDIPTWEMIKFALVDGSPESRIITTTRICDVAKRIGGVYNIKPLSLDNSKNLFYTRIFGDEGISLDDRSTEVSNKIIRKCGGVPLSIITMASMLVGKSMDDWSMVYDSIGFGHGDNKFVQNTRKILSFSYYDLPFALKTCLLYISVFPEDSWIEKNSLIWRWIAEGFVPVEQGIGLFQLGESFFNELTNRSMIRLIEPSAGNTLVGCRVHDMVLDLIRSLSSELNFVTLQDREHHNMCSLSGNNSVHRLALHKRSEEHNPISMEIGQVRSFHASLCCGSMMPSVSRFRVLRVLALDNCDILGHDYGFEHLGKLVQLRYIGLVETPISELPKEIGHDLKFLQTLDVRGSGIEELPASVGELRKLMCLRASEGTRMMAGIGRLLFLEELELHSLDKSLSFAKELGKLTEMRVLVVHFDEMGAGVQEALVESLRNLGRIQTLEIWSDAKGIVQLDCFDEWMPSSELRQLKLCGIILPGRPSWMESSCVPHLSYLMFTAKVVEARDLQILGRLPSLGYLYIWVEDVCLSYTVCRDEFENLRHLNTNMEIMCGEGALPMLQELVCGASVGTDVGLVCNMPLLACITELLDCENCTSSAEGALTTPRVLVNDLGCRAMPLLESVTYLLDCNSCGAEDVEEAEATLMHARKVHQNGHTLKIRKYNGNDEFGEAYDYVLAVKEMFQDNPRKYREFLKILKDYRTDRMDLATVIIHVKALFNGYPELIFGFNVFLPKEYEIKHQKNPVDFMEAISFVNKIKSRFQQEDHIYKSFLGILTTYQMHDKSTQDVYDACTVLFHDHPDLLQEFNHFSTDGSAAAPTVTVPRGVSVKEDSRNAQGAELLKEEDEVKLQHGVLQLMMFVETLDGGSRTSTKPPASVLAISADMDG